MARITIRIDDDLYARLTVKARNAGLGAATYCRDILERFEGTDPEPAVLRQRAGKCGGIAGLWC